MRIITPTIFACAILNAVVISAPSDELINEATARINAAVDAGLAKTKVTYNVGLNDHLFVRRVYTDLAGRIPTRDEVQEFIKSTSVDKRNTLINRLLASEDFVSNSYNWLADLLRIQSQIPGTKLRTDAFSFWLKQQLKSNRPFDKMVHEMVTAKGRIWDNPATGYHLRDNGMKLDHVSYMTKAFLGTNISCAQCHDAPFHDWTQFEYYELTSFLAKMDTRENLQKRPTKPRKSKGKGKAVPAKKDPKSLYINRNQARDHLAKKHKIDTSNEKGQQQLRRLANRFNRAYREIVAANELVVHSNPKAILKLPETYEYDDAKPGQVIKPRAIFGSEPKSRTTSERMRFANWLISRNNPRFSINLGNRLWQRYLGRGAAEPLHDMPEPKYWDNPELVRTLQGTVLALDYDLRAITKAIVSSKAYSALASTGTVKLSDPYFFPGPVLRRMSAEQIWDSLLTLMVEDPFAYRRTSGKAYNEIINMMDTGAVPIAEFVRIAERYNAYRPDNELVDRNGKPVNAKLSNKSKKGSDEMMMMMRDARRNRMILARASELPQPAPQGHFLRDFGQSNRNFLVDAATLEGSVPQVMELMNGAATQILANRNSLIFQKIKAEKKPLNRAEIVFLSILSRKMTPNEQAMMVQELKRGDAALTDLIWALLNTPEFMFIK
jgi:hypothetical protein